MPLITIVPDAKPTDGGLEWSNDRETVDGGMEVYPAGGKIGPTHQEIDSLSDDDDFSDDLSLVDSDDEKRFDLNRYSPHNAIQVLHWESGDSPFRRPFGNAVHQLQTKKTPKPKHPQNSSPVPTESTKWVTT
ncbi:hypothetical protein HUJ04_004300 [Dendroctonus ponderosae]|nr:hypothetical protein HUJ04_004300 [Dendroctonus ponderosae]